MVNGGRRLDARGEGAGEGLRSRMVRELVSNGYQCQGLAAHGARGAAFYPLPVGASTTPASRQRYCREASRTSPAPNGSSGGIEIGSLAVIGAAPRSARAAARCDDEDGPHAMA